ncbi:MAG: helix-turn-helix domain-containing protein [Sphingomonadales bacterium]|nr:helix-turn-helix domain-containing protein [Sphingomonadales bacterium]
MSDFSDPNHRPLRVITFLAAHATEAFTLAEIARLLDLSKGSAHRVMMALTEAGFVSRHPRHKTYTLGMTLVAIGQAALDRYPGVAIAQREMARLRADLNLGFGATAIVNHEYLLLGREGTPRTYDGLTLVGERRAVVPSIGIGQIAWRGDAAIAAYLDSGTAYLSPDIRRHLERAIPVIRRRGYAMAAEGIGLHRLIKATVISPGEPEDETLSATAIRNAGEILASEFQMLDWDDAPGKGVNYVAAPVFSPEGEACLEIVMSAFPEGCSRSDLERFTARLVQAADYVTHEIRGRKPKPW